MAIAFSDVTVEPGQSPISVTGSSVSVSNFPASQPVSGTVAVTQSTSPWVTSTTPVTSNTATITQVVATNATNIQVLASNANRKKAILFFPKGSATSYLKFGSSASATSFTYIIVNNSTTLEIDIWTGELDYNGTAQTITVTELS